MNFLDKLILGTVQLGIPYGINNHTGQPDQFTANEILHSAWAGGIRLLDTAESYGNAQQVIGHYHVGQSESFHVITKLMPGKTPAEVRPSLIEDMNLLNVDSLYGFMFHHLDVFKQNVSALDDLKSMQAEGLIKRIGVSVYSNDEFEYVLNFPEINLIQLPFNMLDNWHQRGECIRKAKEKGIEIHVRSVFLQGLFFMKEADIPVKLNPLVPFLRQLGSICKEFNMSMEMAAMGYALAYPEIDKVLIGVETPLQLEDNLAQIAKLQISKAFLSAVEEIQITYNELLSPVNWK
jgi:aryl-alcohol dehydrogenase-like predicted oxidoreductase